MFRKFLAVAVALMLVGGGLFADEIKGVFKKYEDGNITVEVDGKEATYKVDPDAKMKRKTKDGTEKEFELTKALSSPFYKDGTKVTLTYDPEKKLVTAAKAEFMRKKKDN